MVVTFSYSLYRLAQTGSQFYWVRNLLQFYSHCTRVPNSFRCYEWAGFLVPFLDSDSSNLFTNISFTRISTIEELHNAMMLCEPELMLFSQFQ